MMDSISDTTLPRPELLDLPWNDVIVLKIIPLVPPSDWPSLRAVCRQFYILVSEFFQHTKHLDLSSCSHNFPKRMWELMIQECYQLRIVNLSNFKWCDDRSLRILCQNNQNLEHLDLSGCSSLSEGSLQPLVNNCKGLKTIILKNCQWLSVGAVEILAFHYPHSIKKADFSECRSITEASISLFIRRQNKLESLAVAGLQSVRDETLFILAQNCALLVDLDVSRCPRVTDKGIQMIGEYCRMLKTIKVQGCNHVSEKSLSRLRIQRIIMDRPTHPPHLRNQLMQNWPRTQV